MRIISGKLKGKKFFLPKNTILRPTTDKTKESLFNILSNKINFNNSIVIDLFCGTGNITYEFASRGILKIESIDNSLKCIEYIRKNFKKFNIEKQCKAFREDIFSFLKRKKLKSYDLVFADPPYNFSKKKIYFLINQIIYKKLIKNNGYLILEHSIKLNIPNIPLYEYYTKKYGKICLSFFNKKNN